MTIKQMKAMKVGDRVINRSGQTGRIVQKDKWGALWVKSTCKNYAGGVIDIDTAWAYAHLDD